MEAAEPSDDLRSLKIRSSQPCHQRKAVINRIDTIESSDTYPRVLIFAFHDERRLVLSIKTMKRLYKPPRALCAPGMGI
ncbi:hypothetical protein BCR37DRAFT_381480 [Protomyces lactucae-debilis]|uniref:Uncharacterized protein n=1 Tax=Protomyces lactucae-debilis TaxID=2754530 RepID=A0A1Y2F9M2_PROLT|nr:uncharacterized protein BCR37DRAFT_381480 [Protomyces lactucae-debilis]ORY80026.1 hypothetical protein BCR37DRAFT_381480 [Protomyces lactucae-debilis]